MKRGAVDKGEYSGLPEYSNTYVQKTFWTKGTELETYAKKTFWTKGTELETYAKKTFWTKRAKCKEQKVN